MALATDDKVLAIIRAADPKWISTTGILNRLGVDKNKRPTLRNQLLRLQRQNRIVRQGEGKHRWRLHEAEREQDSPQRNGSNDLPPHLRDKYKTQEELRGGGLECNLPGCNAKKHGNWIRVYGDTYPHRLKLREAGFRFDSDDDNDKYWYGKQENLDALNAGRKEEHPKGDHREKTPAIDSNAQDRISELELAIAMLVEGLTEARADAEAARKAAKEAQEATADIPRRIEVLVNDQDAIELDGVLHERFEECFQLAQARENIMLYGPTGCGKTYLAGQVADALELPFYSISCTSGMSEGQLGGRLLPVGKGGEFKYVESEFVKAFENGGVFLLDEIDAADSNVLLFINTALANGVISLPNRPEKPRATMHEDFVCIASANTLGTGADRLYAGRNQLDAATLDRFGVGKIICDYDTNVEAKLCPDNDLRARLQRYREAINEHRLERCMSTRFMEKAYNMVTKCGWTMEQIDDKFFAGWRSDEIEKVKTY